MKLLFYFGMAKESKRELLTRIRVLLWSAPRCLSSVLERSVRELSSVKVIYEPHHAAYYHGPERKIEPAKGTADYDMADVLQSKYSLHNYDYADRKLLENYDGHGALFAKDMAYFIPNERFEVYTRGELKLWYCQCIEIVVLNELCSTAVHCLCLCAQGS